MGRISIWLEERLVTETERHLAVIRNTVERYRRREREIMTRVSILLEERLVTETERHLAVIRNAVERYRRRVKER
jgi:hypothetical protein